VDYAALAENRRPLDAYLTALAVAEPGDWSRADRMAFWINAYNAVMVGAVLDRWPLDSVLDAGRILGVIPTGSIFREKHRVAGADRSLDDIEHGILRGRFHDPRIHAAVNCASRSCPRLGSRAYTGADLDRQLDAAMTGFILDETRNRLRSDPPGLSAIFKWYAEDFEAESPSVWAYIRAHVSEELRNQLPAQANPRHLPYDWGLNRQKNGPTP